MDRSDPVPSVSSSPRLLSLYTDRKIGTKIVLGFACVLAIMAAISLVSYRGFATVNREFARFAEGLDELMLVRNVDREFVGMRRLAREYMLATVAPDPAPVFARQAQAQTAIERAVAGMRHPQRRALLDHVASQYKTYAAGFAAIVPLRHDQSELRRTVLGPRGTQVTADIDRLLAWSAAHPGDSSVAALTNTVMKQFLIIRVNVSKAFGRIEDTAQAQADAAYRDLQAALAGLETRAGDGDVRRIVAAVRDGAKAYHDAFVTYLKLDERIATLVNVDMPRLAEAIAKDVVAIREAATSEQHTIENETNTLIATTMTFVGLAGLGCVLFGCLLSWLIGRGLARPVAQIGQVLIAIASGNKDVAIPYVDRRDEVGDNARAAQTFKDNLLRLAAMEAEQRAADERAARDRRAAVHAIADEFEAAIGEIVETVSSASTELESAAGTLTHTAETTQKMSANVVSASEEASAGVQSVASATNEMTSSVNEISRQVQESTRIAGEAVKQAEKTDGRITELSQAASRIGDVVKLITAIAEQTNLLALNATIEAARAGEAGKGFAVVAQEVKALAAQTGKATGEIHAQIAGMQAATQDSVAAIKEIGGTIGRIAEIASAIAAAVEEQNAATGEVARNIQHAAHGTTQVASDIVEVSRGAHETEHASEQVRSSAAMLAREGNKLKDEVKRFLMNVRTGPMDRREANDPNYAGPERRAVHHTAPAAKAARSRAA